MYHNTHSFLSLSLSPSPSPSLSLSLSLSLSPPPSLPLSSDVISAIRDSFLRDDLWDGDEGDDHIIKDFIKQCVSKSVSTLDNLSQLGGKYCYNYALLNSTTSLEEEGEDLLLFKDLGGEKMSEVMSLIRKGVHTHTHTHTVV